MNDGIKKLKIAVLIRRFITTGGAERYAVEVTKRLAMQHDVHVFAHEWGPEDTSKITFHQIPKFPSKPGFINQLLFSYFTRKSLDDTFDIIHTHERVTHFDVLTIHCPCYRGFITYKKGFWRKLMVWISVLTSPRHLAYLWLEKKQFTCEKNRLFVAVSENVKKDIRVNYSLNEKDFRIAYPGVNMKRFQKGNTSEFRKRQRSKLGIDNNNIVILFVGTEFKRKGLEALLKAVAAMDDDNIKLLVAGGGKQKKYRRLAKRLGITNSVIFLGLVTNIEDTYAMSDIYVLPTLSDPSPMAPIEAMASGLPAVMSVSKYAGSSEHIRNGEALLIENPKDSLEIKNCLNQLMDKKYRMTLIEKGYELTRGLTWEKTTEDTLNVYYDVLNLKKKKLYIDEPNC
jgi:UDP-glucose:(heptosyl)LPS alpha-1,3-glucosyltransferase